MAARGGQEMPSAPAKGDGKEVVDQHSLPPPQGALPPVCLGSALWYLAAWALAALLRAFRELQDAMLAIKSLREMAVWGMSQAAVPALLSRIRKHAELDHSFSSMPYFVSEEAKTIMLHAATHTLSGQNLRDSASPSESGLPTLQHVLLQAGADSSRFQEAVASAVSYHMGANLLVVDNAVLKDIAASALEEGINHYNPQDPLAVGGSGLIAFFLSFFFRGGRRMFAWELIHSICKAHRGPLVVLVKKAEDVICSSEDAFMSFEAVFGTSSEPSNGRPPLILAGTELVDTGAHLLRKPAAGLDSSLFSDESDVGEDQKRILPTASDLALALEGLRPDPRTLLASVFHVQVALGPVPEGPPGAEHRSQIVQDAQDELCQRAYTKLVAAAGSTGIALPPQGSIEGLFSDQELTEADWKQVLAWAVPMERMLIREQQGEADLLEDTGRASTSKPRRSLSSSHVSQSASKGDCPLLSDLAPRDVPKRSGDLATDLQLQISSLKYGMEMFRKAGGRLRRQVEAENPYEVKLLSEVVYPEQAGRGFSEVGALEHAKDALREAVQLPLQHPRLFSGHRLLAVPCLGVLLFGPPGTGKTMLARATAAQCGASFLVLSPSTVVSKWLGDGVKLVRAAFSLAKKLSPCCIFVDEVDALLGKRDSNSEHHAMREVKNEFMAQWDGIVSGARPSRVMVLAATNRPQDLDEAVLRRFTKRVFCDLPNASARTDILKAILANEPLAASVSLDSIAAETEGFTGSDLKRLATSACMRTVRDFLREQKTTTVPRQQVELRGSSAGRANRILADFKVLSSSSEEAKLRRVDAEDFKSATLEVTSSVNADSHAMTELRQWNAKFGEGKGSGYKETALTYFT